MIHQPHSNGADTVLRRPDVLGTNESVPVKLTDRATTVTRYPRDDASAMPDVDNHLGLDLEVARDRQREPVALARAYAGRELVQRCIDCKRDAGQRRVEP